MVGPSGFGQAIIITVYLPILALTGIAGKLCTAMALPVIIALVAALVPSPTFVPPMVALVIRGGVSERANCLVRTVNRAHEASVRHAVRVRWVVVPLAFLLFL